MDEARGRMDRDALPFVGFRYGVEASSGAAPGEAGQLIYYRAV
jgi:hypothetical protein